MRNFRYKGITIYEDKPTKDGRKFFLKNIKMVNTIHPKNIKQLMK